MTSPMKLDIRVVRAGGGTHLARTVDEMDLSWLSDLVAELRLEQAAAVTLTDPDGAAELVVRIDQDGYRVERTVSGAGSRLAQTDPFGPSHAEIGRADEHYVDLEAARQALRSVLLREDLAPGLRWTEPG
ncbi:MAG TPA: hypothetical protein VF462_02735 [Micromonosporaceae bacterium]